MTNRVVVVALHDASGNFIAIFCSREKVKVSTQVVVLNLEDVHIVFSSRFRSLKFFKTSYCFWYSILELEIVYIDQLILKVKFVLKRNCLEECVIRLSESLVKDLVGTRLTNFVSA